MSNPLEIAFVVEGPTDFHMLEAVIGNLLEGRDYVPHTLQPERSEAFEFLPGEEGGWPGVCRWCLQAAEQGGGKLSNNIISNKLFDIFNLLILQLDADVAKARYSDGGFQDPFPAPMLPCEKPCPPPFATTDPLRAVALGWMGEPVTPPFLVLCTPSKALETWVLVGLFPHTVARWRDVECRPNPANTLRGQPMNRRLVRGRHKDVDMYRESAPKFARNWNEVTARCSEAARFENDFLCALAQL
jgi:hypothetical protein